MIDLGMLKTVVAVTQRSSLYFDFCWFRVFAPKIVQVLHSAKYCLFQLASTPSLVC